MTSYPSPLSATCPGSSMNPRSEIWPSVSAGGLLRISDQVRVYAEPTEGMCLEIAEAERLGITIMKLEFE